MIYAMRDDRGYIKIGSTGNLRVRAVTLSANYQRHLEILGTATGGKTEEKDLHNRFKRYQLYAANEYWRLTKTDWFLPMRCIYQWVADELTPFEGNQPRMNERNYRISDIERLVLHEEVYVKVICENPLIVVEAEDAPDLRFARWLFQCQHDKMMRFFQQPPATIDYWLSMSEGLRRIGIEYPKEITS
jgi:hypothetical protein